jgi:phage terminase small subunit
LLRPVRFNAIFTLLCLGEDILANEVTTLESLEYTPVEPSECGNYWITPDGKKHRPLSPRHKKFCQLYIQGMSGAEAARRSGFTKHKFGAKAQGSALLRRNPLIRNHIIDLLTRERERSAVSMEAHLTELSRLRDEAADTGQLSSAISAEISRGKAAGLYIEKKEVTVNKIESMSDEELRSKLQALLDGSNIKVVEHVSDREEFLSGDEEEFIEGPLAEDRDGSITAGGP